MPEQRYAVDTLPFGGDEDQPHEFGRLISQKIASEGDAFYHHYDALGSTLSLTDSAEVVTDEYDYNAFGETVASTGVTPNPCQWVAEYGYRRDEESGLYDLRRRNYDTQSGRFKALGVFNQFGDTATARQILENMARTNPALNQEAIDAALRAWRAGGGA